MARSASAPGSVERDVEEEAVELGLGQREGALVLDRVLGGDHHEGVGQRPGDAAGGDLPLGHGLEEGGLHLGRGAVDLVDEDERVEERAGDEVEAARRRGGRPGCRSCRRA